MPPRPVVRLVQLPIPQPAKGAATGNVPLAAGTLAVALREGGAPLEVDVLLPDLTDALGDTRLAERLAHDEPAVVGMSLYLWNVERSLHVAREVKRRSPDTRIVIGGPEVAPDNPFVLESGAFDVAVTGEAEEVVGELIARVVAGDDVSDLPGVGVAQDGAAAVLAPPRAATFALDRFPSPYVAGALPVDPRRASYVETVRGCRSHCTFCFYPRSSAVLRSLDVPASRALVDALAARGAREVVFLDPTFNHREGFDALLESLAVANSERRLTFFAEVRAEGLTAARADLLAEAGFTKLEIGLQSINPKALAKSRRGGSAEKVAAAAIMLKDRGIDPIVDLIVGLPEDRPEDVLAGVDFLIEHGLEAHAQVFPLSLLPGTAMRADASTDGVRFDAAPPYHVISTETMPAGAIGALLEEAEERLDRRVEEEPRPWLVETALDDQTPDVFSLDLDRDDDAARDRAARPGAAHVALRLIGDDLWAARDRAADAIRRRLAVDPHAGLDIVLAPRRPFPLNLLGYLRQVLDAGPASYASRVLRLRGEDMQRRVTVLLADGARGFPDDWVTAVDACVPVFADVTPAFALERAVDLGDRLPGARVVGALPGDGESYLRALAAHSDPGAVAFADRRAELVWVERFLAFGESGSVSR